MQGSLQKKYKCERLLLFQDSVDNWMHLNSEGVRLTGRWGTNCDDLKHNVMALSLEPCCH